MANKLLLLVVFVACLAPHIHSQVYTQKERDQIIQKHRRLLDQESLELFEAKLKESEHDDKFSLLVDYEGVTDELQLGNISWHTIASSELLNPLVGIDYKRHDHRHHLLCFSNTTLLVRAFRVHKTGKLEFDNTFFSQRVDGWIKHALFYREYNKDELYVAALILKGVYTIRTFKVDKGLVSKDQSHQFQLGEDVIKIDSLHYGLSQHKLVALTTGKDLRLSPDGEIIKLTMPRATHLKTLRILTQGFIVGSNSTHLCAFRYQEQNPEFIVMYRSRSMIVDLKTMIINGNRHYIMVAAQFHQMIYRWDGSTFTPDSWSRLPNVFKLNPLSMSYAREDNFFYFDQHNQNLSNIYIYNNDNQKFPKWFELQKFNVPSLPFNPKFGNHFSEDQTAIELKVYNGLIYVFAYQTYMKQLDKKPKAENIILNLIQGKQYIDDKLNNIILKTTKFEKRETILRTRRNIAFGFDVRFEPTITTKRLAILNESPSRRVPEEWLINNRELDSSQVLVHLDTLRGFISSAHERSTKVKQELDTEVVYKSSTGAITGFKEFVNGITVPRIEATLSQVDYFRGLYVSELLSKLYRTSTNMRIEGTKFFAVNTQVSNSLRVNRLNRVRPEDFLYGSLPQDLYSDFWYEKELKVDQLHMGDQLAANVSLSKAVFINQPENLPVVIQNLVIFKNLEVHHLQVNQIDNLLMTKLPEQVLRKSAKKTQTFKIPTRLNKLQASSDVFTEKLNGRNTSTVFANLVRLNGVVHIDKPVYIDGDAIFQFLDLNGKLNGIRVPEDLLDRHSDQTIRGVKKFSQLAIKNLKVGTLNNNIHIPNDIITLSQDEEIHGHLFLDALRVDGNLLVDGLVDRINMTHFDQRYISTLQNHYQSLTFYKPVKVNWLKVKGLSDNFDIERIYRDSIFTDTQVPVHISGMKMVTSILKCRAISAEQVNRQNTSHFLTTNEPGSFMQRVTFKAPVQFAEVKLRNTLDKVPINEILENVASLNDQHVIFGRKNFLETVHVDKLIVWGTINRIQPKHFMRYSAEQNITGRKSFRDAHVRSFTSSNSTNLRLTGNLNAQHFGQMSSKIVWFNKAQSLDTVFYCGNCSASHIDSVYVNGKNFTYFQQNYLSKTRPQTIRGNKNFQGVQHFANLKTRTGVVAGINMTQLREEAITLHGKNVIVNDVLIEGDLTLNNGRLTTKMFNHIDINEYYRKAVRNNHSEVVKIHGRIIYAKGFDLHADMDVTSLNGLSPADLFMTTTGNYSIQTNVDFAGRVMTSGNLRVRGRINGIDLAQLDQNILKVNGRGEVNGSVNFLQNVNVQHLSVSGLIDGVPVNRESVLMSNAEQRVNHMLLNGPVDFQQNVMVKMSINGHRPDNLNMIVKLDSPLEQKITASKTFHKVIARDIYQSKGDLHVKIINGVNLRDFEKDAVYSTRNQTMRVKQHFVNNVTLATRKVNITGHVNNINLLTEVIRLDVANQTITGIKTFERVNLNDDIDVHGQVNAFDLPLIQKSVLYSVGEQSIPNVMTFKAPIYLASDSQVDRINYIEPANLLTLDGDQQVVNGQLKFGQVNFADSVTSKYVNNVNLTDIAKHVLYKNSPKLQKVPGTILVNKARFDDDVNLKYHLNQVDLNVAVEAAKKSLNQTFDMEHVVQAVKRNVNKLHSQQTKYEYANFEIDYLQPSPLYENYSIINGIKFDYVFQYFKTGRRMFDQVAKLMPLATYQPFVFRGYTYVAVSESQYDRSSLQILRVISGEQQLVTIYPKHYYPPNVKLLVFAMDDSIYIFNGMTRLGCDYQEQSYLMELSIDKRGYFVNDKISQKFADQGVLSVGHFIDESAYHHLVFSSQSSGLESQIKIYKRFRDCETNPFELVQTIEASNVQFMALFKFGIPGLVEQYMATLSSNKLTLWKQRGVFGFSQHWSARASANPVSNLPMQLLPFIRRIPKSPNHHLIIYAPSCPAHAFEAVLNGHFTNLQLLYDDY